MLLAACGGAGAPGPAASPTAPVSERPVAFRDAGVTGNSGQDDDAPRIDAVRAGSGLRITAYQGGQPSGGYSIQIERITRVGNELRVQARFIEPAPGSFNTMALTSPAHTVTVDETSDVIVLYDATGVERARARTR